MAFPGKACTILLTWIPIGFGLRVNKDHNEYTQTKLRTGENSRSKWWIKLNCEISICRHCCWPLVHVIEDYLIIHILLTRADLIIEAELRIYASTNYAIIGSDNGLSPVRRKPIIRNNAGLLSIKTQETNFNEILFKIQKLFKKMQLKMLAPILSRFQCVKTILASLVSWLMRHSCSFPWCSPNHIHWLRPQLNV